MALVKAKFIVLKTKKNIPVHFNPSEYSIAVKPLTGEKDDTKNAIGVRGAETLSLKLYFDTYTRHYGLMALETSVTPVPVEDVRFYTEEIARLVSSEKGSADGPVNFVWGSLNFTGTVSQVSQKFTMFLDDGKPVRAELSVTMERKSDLSDVYIGTGMRSLPDLTDNSWKAAAATVVTRGKLRDLLTLF